MVLLRTHRSVGRPGSFYFNVETNTDCDENFNISDTFCLLFMTWFTHLDMGGVCYASCIVFYMIDGLLLTEDEKNG